MCHSPCLFFSSMFSWGQPSLPPPHKGSAPGHLLRSVYARLGSSLAAVGSPWFRRLSNSTYGCWVTGFHFAVCLIEISVDEVMRRACFCLLRGIETLPDLLSRRCFGDRAVLTSPDFKVLGGMFSVYRNVIVQSKLDFSVPVLPSATLLLNVL